jgi:hypothetical protein
MSPSDKARRAVQAVKAAARRSPQKADGATRSTLVRASANGSAVPRKVKNKALSKAQRNLFRVEACCDQCRSSNGTCGWPTAVLAELRRCTGGEAQASTFLSALAGCSGISSADVVGGLQEAQRMLENYVWHLKVAGDTAPFDAYQALPHIVTSCCFPAGLRSSTLPNVFPSPVPPSHHS